MPTLRKVCSHGVRVVVQAILVLSLVALVVLALGPRTGRYQAMTVLTGSMRPTIPEGSIVLAVPTAAADVRSGDVITFHIPVDDRRVVTHRVVEVLEGGEQPVIRTRGDANDAPDPWTARMGPGPLWKVRAVVPSLGYGVNALRAPAIQRTCVLLLPLVLCVIWLREIWLPRRPRRRAPEAAPV
jgi:signal peptidase